MGHRAAIAWILLLLVGLLLGLLITVVAVGVSRHVRRQRHRTDPKRGTAKRTVPDDEGDEPSSFSRSSPDTSEDPES